jgi:hypothetical protein
MMDLDQVDFEFDDEMPEFDEDGITVNKTEEKPKGAPENRMQIVIYISANFRKKEEEHCVPRLLLCCKSFQG